MKTDRQTRNANVGTHTSMVLQSILYFHSMHIISIIKEAQGNHGNRHTRTQIYARIMASEKYGSGPHTYPHAISVICKH